MKKPHTVKTNISKIRNMYVPKTNKFNNFTEKKHHNEIKWVYNSVK